MIVRKIGPKGQVVIPSHIRQMLEITPGGEVIVDVEGDKVVIKPKKESIVEHLSNLVPEEEKQDIEKIDLDRYYEEEFAKHQRS